MTPQNELALLEDRLALRVWTMEAAMIIGKSKMGIAIARERVEAFLAANGARMRELREQERGRT